MKVKSYIKKYQTEKRNKIEIKLILYAALFLTVWILFGFNTYNADYSQYEYAYNSYSLDAHGRTNEVGFKLLCAIFKFLGFPYQAFLIIFSFCGLLIMFKSIREYTDNYLTWAFCYLFFPFAFDVPQIRTFAVEVIVIYAIRYLTEYNRKNVIHFILCMILAMSFHSIGIMYLVLMLAYLRKKETVAITSFFITGGLIFISFFANGLVIMAFKMLSFLGANISGGVNYVVFWPSLRKLMFEYLAIGSVIIFLIYINKKHLVKNISNENFQKIAVVIEKITYISLIFIPLKSFGPSFGRIYGRVLPLLYCGMIQKSRFLKNGKWSFRILISNCACIGIAATLFYFHVYTGDQNTFERVFKVLFENNMLF